MKVQVVLPECSEDEVSDLLRRLTKAIVEKDNEKRVSGFLGGEFGYGCRYDNEVFMMHPFCWCEKDDCPWCKEGETEANFHHKPSGAKVWWYKYIGRGMEVKMPEGFDMGLAIREAIKSVK